MKPLMERVQIVRNTEDTFEAFMDDLRWQAYRGERNPISVARSIDFSATLTPEAAMARLRGLNAKFHAVGGNAVELVDKGAMVRLGFNQKADYISVHGTLYADTVEAADEFESRIHAVFNDRVIREPMFRMYWQFAVGRGESRTAVIEERANDVLLSEAYPDLGDIHKFVTRYIEAEETVLVVIGPPGTGKTRLIRYILGEMARRNMASPNVLDEDMPASVQLGRDWGQRQRVSAMYANDESVIKQGKLFVDFMTGDSNALVIEDADHLLLPRHGKDNDTMHYFLAAADGVMRAQGRKIIFSTNLPNVNEVDEALIRPGRCHGVVSLRRLGDSEANRLALALARQPYPNVGRVRDHSVAEVYAWARGLEKKDVMEAA